jgi:hypothetical protein
VREADESRGRAGPRRTGKTSGEDDGVRMPGVEEPPRTRHVEKASVEKAW